MPQVNVILHGLIALYERPKQKQIVAFLIDLPAAHSFRAGNWLTEQTLLPGHYALEGVKTGEARLSYTANLHVGQIDYPMGLERSAHAVITLPFPGSVVATRRIKTEPDKDFGGTDASKLRHVQWMCPAQILTYDAEKLNDVRLFRHSWEPLPCEGKDSLNLHIHAEEETPNQKPSNHGREAFRIMLKAFADMDVELRNDKPIPDFDHKVDHPPDDVDPRETDDLSSRQTRLAEVGRRYRPLLHLIRSGGNPTPDVLRGIIKPFEDNHLVVHPDGTRMGACSQAVGSEDGN